MPHHLTGKPVDEEYILCFSATYTSNPMPRTASKVMFWPPKLCLPFRTFATGASSYSLYPRPTIMLAASRSRCGSLRATQMLTCWRMMFETVVDDSDCLRSLIVLI